MAEQTREEVDAKIAHAVAELHIELIRLGGKIDNLTVRVDGVAKEIDRLWGGMKFMVGTTITVGLALAGLIAPSLWLLLRVASKVGALG
jgi:hypothetical protein